MRAQELKPETLAALLDVAMGHQWNNFVRIPSGDASFHFQRGRRILILRGEKAFWAETEEECESRGKKFTFFR
jgi:hypothetical protein